MGVRRVDQRCAASPVRLTLVAAIVAGSLVALAPSAGAAVGSMTTFAGGVGWGKATNVAQSPIALGMLGDRVLEVDGPVLTGELPLLNEHFWSVVRLIDTSSGQESVVAGVDAPGNTPDGALAVGGPFGDVVSVAGDAAGNVYFSEGATNRIRKVSPSGVVTTVAGTGGVGFAGDGGPATQALLQGPNGIAVGPDGAVVFSDSGNQRVRRIAPNGIISTVAGNGTIGADGDGGPAVNAQLSSPRDVGLDGAGNVYIADLLNNRIRMVSPAGTITTFAQTEFPRSMVVRRDGLVLVAYGHAIRSIAADGTTTTLAGAPTVAGFVGDGGPATEGLLNGPRGITVDAKGTVYVADSGNKRVRRIDTAGVLTTVGGNGLTWRGGDGGPAVAARLWQPVLVRTGSSGTYIVDRGNDRVARVDAAGFIETVHEGPDVLGMAVDSAGNLYLSERGRILKRTPAGVTSVVAGAGEPIGGGPLAVDGSGNTFIAEWSPDGTVIRRIDRSGHITVVAGSDPPGPYRADYPEEALHSPLGHIADIAVAPDGALYALADYKLLRIWCGVVSRVAVDLTIGTDVAGLAIDRLGNMFVAIGGVVHRITPEGGATLVAGGGTAAIRDGQQATTARLRSPIGAPTLDASGNLLLPNAGRVLKVDGVSVGAATPGAECTTPLVPVVPPAEPASSYQPLTPARILDTRIGTGGFGAAVGPAATISLGVRGVGGVPATRVSAIAVNLTVTQPTAEGYISAFPSGATRPLTSSVNFLPGQTVANLVVAKVGADGRISIFNATGRTHVVADVVGWYGDAGAMFQSGVPTRLLDTRDSSAGFSAPLRPNETRSLSVMGGFLATSGASAVVLNVTVTQPTAEGYVSAYPSGADRPPTSSVNFLPGQTVANLVVAKVGSSGKVDFYNATGSTHLVVDLVGWYQETGATFNALVPSRIVDTRNGTGGFSTPVGPDGTIAVPVTGVGGVSPVDVSAVVLNVTVTQPTAGGYISVYPPGYPRPLASSVNFSPGRTVANLVVAKVGTDGKVRIYNVAGHTHVVIDVIGWYGLTY